MATFTRPAGFVFRPGQWIRLTLQTTEGEQTKTFSISSAPSDSVIETATRLSGSPFKKALATLDPGDRVPVTGPGGRLHVPGDAAKVAFLVGGVGVTPARSILRDAAQTGRRFEDAVVFFGDRDPSCTPYREELESYGATGVRVVAVYERAPADSAAERGFITAEIVRRHIDDPSEYGFLVSGPPVMVEAMTRVMNDLGVSEERRAIESFGPIEAGSRVASR